jgi:16S rRNA (uracil1498-N3)-methyltransferase
LIFNKLNTFFYNNELVSGTIHLNDNDSRHAIKSLRLKEGDNIQLINGIGVIANAIITAPNPKKTTCEITNFSKSTPPIALALAFCPTKNNDRNEWIIEKCTEIGVTDFFPVFAKHSERRKWNKERMHKIAIAAIKQSGNLWLPNIHEPCNYDQLFKSIDPFKNRFIAHCISSQKKVLNKLIQQNDSQLILIGPEGDFNKDELDMALKNGFKEVILSNNTLRTETAAILSIAIMKGF